MGIKNIICAYSGEEAKSSGLHHALKLARHHNAWLTGVLSHGRPELERRYAARLPDQLIDALRNADQELSERIRVRFKEEVESASWSERSDFVDLDASSEQRLAQFARAFDLIVTGVHSDSMDDTHLSANPDLIALQSGRPVLIVPKEYEADGLANHALVAWDGKRSVARALGDAMPVLEEKASVTLLTVGPESIKGMDRLVCNMERHGIHVKPKIAPRSGSVAETILGEAESAGARLIVMGAYEHSKFAHSLFGGVTTDVMRLSAVPVFMAH